MIKTRFSKHSDLNENVLDEDDVANGTEAGAHGAHSLDKGSLQERSVGFYFIM